MPSTHKTENLKLNNWIGEDKPKREDWNSDNQKIDTAFNDLNQNMSTHNKNSDIHVTKAEKSLWSAGESASFFTYTGNGSVSRTLTLAEKPVFAVLYAVNKPPLEAQSTFTAYAGFLSAKGCSAGLALTPTGFSVTHNPFPDPSGFALSYNQTDINYICVYWS